MTTANPWRPWRRLRWTDECPCEVCDAERRARSSALPLSRGQRRAIRLAYFVSGGFLGLAAWRLTGGHVGGLVYLGCALLWGLLMPWQWRHIFESHNRTQTILRSMRLTTTSAPPRHKAGKDARWWRPKPP
jgi:hypothetical protein